MEECIFCRIVEGSLGAYKILEEDEVIAFLDIFPVHPGHALVIPRSHRKDVFDCDEETAAKMMRAAKRISLPVMKAVKAEGVNLSMSNREAAGQEVFHAHLHVIPRYKDDGLKHWKKDLFRDEDHKKEVYGAVKKEMG